MGMPDWWSERRLGLFVHSNLASVPAWAPIGEYADWYRSHLGEDVADVLLHPHPMVEVLAHHRDRWGHIERYDDFLPLLTYDAFDSEAWARLAVDAGAGYTVFVAKHHDGWAWWDAPNTDRTMLDGGPRRNVLAEYAAACERNDVVFGTYYSLLDWGDARYPSDAYVDDVLHAHVVDLVERYGSRVLWGDGHWGHGPDRWRTRSLLERVQAIDPDVVVTDRWWADPDQLATTGGAVVRTFEYEAPADIVAGPWELCRGIGSSFCHNQAERAEHHATARDIVALYTEVVAKGGHLLLNVGPAADGSIPALQAEPLRLAGAWIHRYGDLLGRSRPWERWGDDSTRHVVADDSLYAIDLDGYGLFPAIDSRRWRIETAETIDAATGVPSPVGFRQDDDGLRIERVRTIDRRTRSIDDVRVFRLVVAPADRPVELFDPEPRRSIELAPLLRDVRPGDVVQLGDGTYLGPAEIPAGVIVRGIGQDRTRIGGAGATAVTLGRNARLEHVGVVDGPDRIAWFPAPAVEVVGPSATVLGCRVDGHIVVRADDAMIKASSALGVVAGGVDRLSLSRCVLRGMRWDVGVDLIGGVGHVIESCELRDHLCAIRASDTTGVIVRGNNVRARWWGVRLCRTELTHVHGNFVDHTMRGVDLDGGANALVEGNAVCDGDSGCILQAGAADCEVSGNRWERCRVGILVWESPGLTEVANEAIDLHDAAVVTGP
jgi:alpha-L-fucosidase